MAPGHLLVRTEGRRSCCSFLSSLGRWLQRSSQEAELAPAASYRKYMTPSMLQPDEALQQVVLRKSLEEPLAALKLQFADLMPSKRQRSEYDHLVRKALLATDPVTAGGYLTALNTLVERIRQGKDAQGAFDAAYAAVEGDPAFQAALASQSLAPHEALALERIKALLAKAMTAQENAVLGYGAALQFVELAKATMDRRLRTAHAWTPADEPVLESLAAFAAARQLPSHTPREWAQVGMALARPQDLPTSEHVQQAMVFAAECMLNRNHKLDDAMAAAEVHGRLLQEGLDPATARQAASIPIAVGQAGLDELMVVARALPALAPERLDLLEDRQVLVCTDNVTQDDPLMKGQLADGPDPDEQGHAEAEASTGRLVYWEDRRLLAMPRKGPALSLLVALAPAQSPASLPAHFDQVLLRWTDQLKVVQAAAAPASQEDAPA